MARRDRLSFGFLVLVLLIAAGASRPTAQARGGPSTESTARSWTLERTPDGHPDFQGVWANNTVTPLQRPKQWEGKTFLTDAEVAELQTFAAQITENDGDAQFGDGLILAVLNRIAKPTSYDPGTGNYNQFWVVERDWHDRRTSLIVNPADGHLPPMTPDAQKRRAAEVEYRKTHAFEDPEVFPLGERCVNFGVPRVQAGYNSYFQIIQSPGYVTIVSEMAHDARVIPLDGRPHLSTAIRPWNGDSRGRWEGDTLVIDTTNFSPKSDFMGSHEHLQLTERFRRVGPEILEYEFTVNDPTTWTAPWTAMIPLRLKNELLYEYACHEGNDAIPDMLRGHRFEERERAGGAQPERSTTGGGSVAMDEIVAAYAAAWNEPDADARRKLLERAWALNGTYTDPTAHVEGRDALAQHIAGYLKNQPAGTRIVPASQTDVHHSQFRFAWKMIGSDGTVMIEGIDFGSVDTDGRISRIVGFFGPLAPKTP